MTTTLQIAKSRPRLRGMAAKFGTLLLLLLSRTYIVYVIAGLVTRTFRPVASIHLTYPVEARFRDRYAFQLSVLQPLYQWLRWTPCPIGVFWQGGAFGVVFAVPADETTLVSDQHRIELTRLLARLRVIKRLIGAETVTLAGVLPSHIARTGLETGHLHIEDPRPATRLALLSAIEHVLSTDFPNVAPDILLFGGAGFVGTDLATALRERGHVPLIVDHTEPGVPADACLAAVAGQPLLIVDVARRNALAPHIDDLWSGVVLLNETYPEPTGTILKVLKDKGVKVRHVAGLNGTLRPPLPGAYAGAVPCCAAHRLDSGAHAVVKIL